jgi:hypothetical protein
MMLATPVLPARRHTKAIAAMRDTKESNLTSKPALPADVNMIALSGIDAMVRHLLKVDHRLNFLPSGRVAHQKAPQVRLR